MASRRNVRRLLRRLLPGLTHRLSHPAAAVPDPLPADSTAGSDTGDTDLADVDALSAHQINLATVLDALEGNRLEHFVERATWGAQPVIGVPAESARALVDRLRSGDAAYPVHLHVAQPGRAKSYPAREAPAERSLSGSFTVFSYLRHQATGRRFDHSFGCIVDVWEDDSGELRNDRPVNRVSSLITGSSRAYPRPVTVLGRRAHTYAPFHNPPMFSVDFSIDAVFLWVDDSDPAWQERKAQRLRTSDLGSQAEAALDFRFRQFDELRYALRSLDRFAPWVRNVFLVTDHQRPRWLDETGTNLRVIDHSEIVPPEALPTFNPRGITACLHRIPGLADHFLYMNDDLFFGRPARPERFFHSNGVSRFFLSRALLNPRPTFSHEEARLRTAALIETETGVWPAQVLQHTPHAFHRLLLAELAEEFSADWERTVRNPFRSGNDIVPEYLHHFMAYTRRLGTPGIVTYDYFPFGTPSGMKALEEYQQTPPVEVFCVNDVGSADADVAQDSGILKEVLETEFPRPSRYEGSSATGGQTLP